MPQFQMPVGNSIQAKTFDSLDCFVQGYIEAIFFTESGEEGDELYGLTFGHIPPETLAEIETDCINFKQQAGMALREAVNEDHYSDTQAGRDFWFTRNGHGVGFWDRGLGEVGERLTEHAKTFGEVTPYKGDYGQIYMARA